MCVCKLFAGLEIEIGNDKFNCPFVFVAKLVEIFYQSHASHIFIIVYEDDGRFTLADKSEVGVVGGWECQPDHGGESDNNQQCADQVVF